MLDYAITDIAATLTVANLVKEAGWSAEEFLSTFSEETEDMVVDILVEYRYIHRPLTEEELFESPGWTDLTRDNHWVWA